MSPASKRFVVRAIDYDVWEIVIAADSHDEALKKAEAIYLTDDFGGSNAFDLADTYVTWDAVRLVGDSAEYPWVGLPQNLRAPAAVRDRGGAPEGREQPAVKAYIDLLRHRRA